MALVGLAVAFTVVLIMVSRGVDLGRSMILASLAVAISAGWGFDKAATIYVGIALDPETVNLVLIIGLISVLGTMLKTTGSLDRMMESLGGLARDPRQVMVAVPGLIGMLTVPGGAIMSAPMVDRLGDELNYSPERKTAINLLFRHVWYPIFPLYPTLLMLSAMSGLAVDEFIKPGLIVTLSGAALGWLVLFRPAPSGLPSAGRAERQYDRESIHQGAAATESAVADGPRRLGQPPRRQGETRGNLSLGRRGYALLGLAQSMAPVFAALMLSVGLGMYFPLALTVAIAIALINYVPLGGGAKKLWAIVQGRARRDLMGAVRLEPALAGLGIMVFRGVIQTSGVIGDLADLLSGAGIPIIALMFVVPILTGFTVGSQMAATGINASIFLPLLAAGQVIPGLMALFVSSMVGYLVSPLHLCLALSTEYFQSDLPRVYRLLALPIIGMVAAVFVYAVIAGGF